MKKVWFPGVDSLVENMVKTCESCQIVSKDARIHPLQMSQLPDYPWQKVSCDFTGPFPTGEYALVIIDEYSRYPIVEIVKSTSSIAVIPVFDKVFSMYGVPEVVKSDNGTPFQSAEFKKFSEFLGFKHRKISPFWPMANTQSENFYQPLIKACKTAHRVICFASSVCWNARPPNLRISSMSLMKSTLPSGDVTWPPACLVCSCASR